MDLGGLDGGRSGSKVRVVLAMVQGVLVVHQSSGVLALVHPFATGRAGPEIESLSLEDSGDEWPPFDPLLLPGGRRLVASSRRGLVALDLWGLRRLSALGEGATPTRASLGGWGVAAAPVALDGRRIGFLAGGGDRPYRWGIWDVVEGGEPMSNRLDSAKDLEIVGSPCQITMVGRRVLAISTPEGHWAWRVSDSARGTVDAIVRTWPRGEGNRTDRLVMDAQVDSPREFASTSQSFLPRGDDAFDWFYRTLDEAGGEEGCWQYRVALPGLDPSYPSAIPNARGASPIGESRAASDSPEMAFYRDGQIFRRSPTGEALIPHQGRVPRDWSGLQLVDPLVVSVAGGGIEVVSLRRPGMPARVLDLGILMSDPVLWSRWMFTVERLDGDRLVVRRREISFDLAEGGAANPRMEVGR